MTSVPGKASIIVLSYNQLDYTRQCLESILERTSDVPYELVVVDNASSDGSPEYLQDCAAENPQIRLLLNDRNIGFAAGNNQGARESSGEYLVFLNNDTVVTDGWLGGLLRHLADPKVGMVGPVTNSSGNETRIPVDYTDLSDMPAFAEAYTRLHSGKTLKLPMLPMLCVALRRSVWDQIGPMEEAFGVGMFEDDDYALRLRKAGYQLLCVEDVFIHHWGGASFNQIDRPAYWQLFQENRRKLEEKWNIRWTPPLFRESGPGLRLRSWINRNRLDEWLGRISAALVGLALVVMLLRDLFQYASSPASGLTFLALTGSHPTQVLFKLAAVLVVLVLLFWYTRAAAGRIAAWVLLGLGLLWGVGLLASTDMVLVSTILGMLGAVGFQAGLRKEKEKRFPLLVAAGLFWGTAAAYLPAWTVIWFAAVIFLSLEDLPWRYLFKVNALFTAAFVAAGVGFAVFMTFLDLPAPVWDLLLFPSGAFDRLILHGLLLLASLPGLYLFIRRPYPLIIAFGLFSLLLATLALLAFTRTLALPYPLLPFLLAAAGFGWARLAAPREHSRNGSPIS